MEEKPKRASRTSRGSDKGLQRLEKKLAEGDYYEAQQLIKMIMNRYLGQKNFEEAAHILTSGMNSMLQHKQTKCATELGLLLVKLYSDTHTPVSPSTLEIITHHFMGYPEDVDEGRVDFLKAAIRWSITEVNKQGEPLLHDLLADWFTQKKEYGSAQRHFIRGSSPEKFAVMLVSFAKEGHPSEVDLFIARAVLQYLCLGKTKEAAYVLDSYLSAFLSLKITPTPLLNFLGFLLEALNQNSPQVFKVLREKYAPSIQRDPTFPQYLDQIGIQFFKLQPQADGGLGGLLNNFMKAFFSPDAEPEGN